MRRVQAENLLRHSRFLKALARRLLADPTHADDVVQEAWLAALRRPPAPQVSLRAWLAAVVRNQARRVGRREARRMRRERVASRPERVRPTADVVATEVLRRQVVAAVLDLAEPYRSVILLRFYDDLAPREIARRLGVRGSTVRTRIRRGVQQLRGKLDAATGGDRRQWCLGLIPFVSSGSQTGRFAPIFSVGVIAMKAWITVAAVLVGVRIPSPAPRKGRPRRELRRLRMRPPFSFEGVSRR